MRFFQETIHLIGHNILKDGLEVDPEKVTALA